MSIFQEDVTREIFRNIPEEWKLVFYALFAIEMLIFLFGTFRLLFKYSKGQHDPIKRYTDPNPIVRLIRPGLKWGSNVRIKKSDLWARLSHSAVLYGMIILFIGTVVLTIETDIVRPLAPDLSFFKGTFYLVYSLLMDLAGFAVILGLIYFFRRRQTDVDGRFDYTRVDGREPSKARLKWPRQDRGFLVLLFIINFTGFILEGIRITADQVPDFERVSFLGYLLALVFTLVIALELAEGIYVGLWWLHLALVVGFVAFLPYTKGVHIGAGFLSIATQDKMAATRLPKSSPDAEIMGYGEINDLSWRELISLDACIRCGRCHVSCPARTVGQPLSPRDFILDLHEFAQKELEFRPLSRSSGNGKPGKRQLALENDPIILPETIWACTTCRACVTLCPVAVEHVSLIVQIRRRMLEEGEVDHGIQSILEKIDKYGNSFGKPNRLRAQWSKELEFQIKDARKERVDLLWYVGDYASFDPRVQEDTVTFAKIMNACQVDFGLLFEGEKNAGNDIRRVGEEGLFESLVEENLATIEKATFNRIVTTDPHTLNTLSKEYPDFDANTDPKKTVIHYTQLFFELIEAGRLKFPKKFSSDAKITFHDPCFLGRYGGEYNTPRKILTYLGFKLVEMPRCKENSFCCGAGGGVIWKEEEDPGDRPALNRMREAMELGVSKFVVACPKDKVMFGDAVKAVGGDIEVVDIVQLVHQAMSP